MLSDISSFPFSDTFGFDWHCTKRNCPKSLIISSLMHRVTMNEKLSLPTLITVRFYHRCWSVRVLWNIPKLKQAIITIRIRRPMNWCNDTELVRVIRLHLLVVDQCSILSVVLTLRTVQVDRLNRVRPFRWPKTMSNRCIRIPVKHYCTAKIMFSYFRYVFVIEFRFFKNIHICSLLVITERC